jgi:hypothetical protein
MNIKMFGNARKTEIKVPFLLMDTQNWEIDDCSAIFCSENSAIC